MDARHIEALLKEKLCLFKSIKREGSVYLLDFKGGFKYMDEATLTRFVEDLKVYDGPVRAVVIFDKREDGKWVLK